MANKQSSMCAGLTPLWWWLLAVVGLAILYFFMFTNTERAIEIDIKDRVEAQLAQNNIDWAMADLEGRGRDVLLTGVAPSSASRDQAIEIAENVDGVRVVDYEGGVLSEGSAKLTAPVSVKPVPMESVQVETAAAESRELGNCQTKLDTAMANKTVLFAFNSANIQLASYQLLNQIVSVLRECSNAVASSGLSISGHTDNVGNDAYNKQLSQKRADAVKAYLVKAGVDGNILSSVGYGESQPVQSNDTEQGRAQNRRIVFTIKRN